MLFNVKSISSSFFPSFALLVEFRQRPDIYYGLILGCESHKVAVDIFSLYLAFLLCLLTVTP